jgi:hypothetical protein
MVGQTLLSETTVVLLNSGGKPAETIAPSAILTA